MGDLLLYFAAKFRPPHYSWSAISRPPYLTALVMWPNGSGWGGGGLFERAGRVQLNHGGLLGQETITGTRLPKRLRISPFGEHSGMGEDGPVLNKRLLRDGWSLANPGGLKNHDFDARIAWEYEPPITWEKRHPLQGEELILRMLIHGVCEHNNAWYKIDHEVVYGDGLVQSLGRTEWADWSPEGDLLYSRLGGLFRLRYERESLPPVQNAKLIADFSELRFENKEAPAEMLYWPRW